MNDTRVKAIEMALDLARIRGVTHDTNIDKLIEHAKRIERYLRLEDE